MVLMWIGFWFMNGSGHSMNTLVHYLLYAGEDTFEYDNLISTFVVKQRLKSNIFFEF